MIEGVESWQDRLMVVNVWLVKVVWNRVVVVGYANDKKVLKLSISAADSEPARAARITNATTRTKNK